jgi:hypothetical protein
MGYTNNITSTSSTSLLGTSTSTSTLVHSTSTNTSTHYILLWPFWVIHNPGCN